MSATKNGSYIAAVVLLCIPLGPFVLAFLLLWAILKLMGELDN